MIPFEKAPDPAAITHVNLITMESQGVLEGQTVLVEGGRISAVGPDEEVDIPGDAAVIDGSGAFLMPGLANMHAHLIDYDPDPSHLILYLAGGVTTVRALNTRKGIFNWKENIERGVWLGPRIFHSGPAVVGFPDEYRLLALGLKSAVFLTAVLLGMLLLALLVEAGLTPYEALASGTRHPALIAGRMPVDNEWGTIAVGNHADLILLQNNPLQDIKHTTSILGVMVRGQWLPKETLDGAVASYLGNSEAS